MTSAARRRSLRPTKLLPLESGLWAIDEFQPVAAILDPVTGELRRLVSWSALPPPPLGHDWPGPVVLGDVDGLWVQQHRTGPLLRLDSRGRQSGTWTDELQLVAARHGEAWCIPWPPRQRRRPVANESPDTFERVLRVRVDGTRDDLVIDRAVRRAFSTADALVLEVDDTPVEVSDSDTGESSWSWTSRYVHIPWGTKLPARLEVESWPMCSTGEPVVAAGSPRMSVDRASIDLGQPFTAAGGRWLVELDESSLATFSLPFARVQASCYDGAGVLIRTHDLGAAMAVAATETAGPALCIALRRPGTSRSVELVTLRPSSGEVATFLAPDAVDITELCWPLVPPPIDADSYGRQVLARNSSLECYWRYPEGLRPLVDGMTDVITSLRGEWPETCLEWTFLWSGRPGLRVRRSVALFDEVGRTSPPHYPDLQLAEDLETGHVPPYGRARDGTLDM